MIHVQQTQQFGRDKVFKVWGCSGIIFRYNFAMNHIHPNCPFTSVSHDEVPLSKTAKHSFHFTHFFSFSSHRGTGAYLQWSLCERRCTKCRTQVHHKVQQVTSLLLYCFLCFCFVLFSNIRRSTRASAQCLAVQKSIFQKYGNGYSIFI